MVDVISNKLKFSSKGSFFLWDWRDSKEAYVRDFGAYIYFFIKDKDPKKVLDDLFINQMKAFEFRSDFEKQLLLEGNCVGSSFKYLFTKYSGSRFPIFDWTTCALPNKRDTKLAFLENEGEIVRYLSKYID